jgi:hypothetical protein
MQSAELREHLVVQTGGTGLHLDGLSSPRSTTMF